MLPLLRADLFKMHKSWVMWTLWSAMLLFVIGYMLLEALVEPARVAFQFPTDMLTVGTLMQGLGIFLLIFFCAQVVGAEYAYDTWKNLLTRHPGRVNFILSKWLTLILIIVAGLLLMLLCAVLMGFLLQATFYLTGPVDSLSPGGVLLMVLLQSLFAIVAGSVALMGTVIGRSTVIGIIIGFVWFIADIALGQLIPQAWQIITLTIASRSLQDYVTGTNTPYALLTGLLITVVYLILPTLVAAYIFRQRDILGPA